MSRNAIISASVAVLVLLDQATKLLAVRLITAPIEVLPFFSLVNVRNQGAAFGLFSSLGNKFFILVSLAAIGFIIYLLYKQRDSAVGLTLILSGAIGNLIDRIYLGYVRDFLDFYAGKYHWPAFNVADSCLTVGLIVLFISPLMAGKGSHVPDNN